MDTPEKTVEHNRLPWQTGASDPRCDEHGKRTRYDWQIWDANDRQVADCRGLPGNPALIVRAANSHDDLVAAVEELLDLMTDARNGIDEFGGDSSLVVDPIEAEARAALAMAKKEPTRDTKD